MKKIVAATRNDGKLKEIKEMLQGIAEIKGQKELGCDAEIEENGASFEENALLKARGIMELTGLAAMADDSGLCVEALDGAPGIYSARYGGEGASDADRINKLLEAVKDMPEGKRAAYFVSAIAYSAPDGTEFVVRGECHGRLLYEPKGKLGFGYDPIFYYEPYAMSFGELDPDVKNSVSHRAESMKLFIEKLKQL